MRTLLVCLPARLGLVWGWNCGGGVVEMGVIVVHEEMSTLMHDYLCL